MRGAGTPLSPDPDRGWIHLRSDRDGLPTDDFVERLVSSGLSMTGTNDGGDPFSTFVNWQVELPGEAAAASVPGDRAIFRSRTLTFPGFEGGSVRLIQYEFHRGSERRSYAEPRNWMFLLAYGLAGVGPLLLWCLLAGIAALGGLTRAKKSAIRD